MNYIIKFKVQGLPFTELIWQLKLSCFESTVGFADNFRGALMFVFGSVSIFGVSGFRV